jgi:hypothetical protein
MVSATKSRAKRLGIPFDLTEEDLVIPTHCPALGIPLATSPDGNPSPNSPSIDRLRPELGYVKGNVVVISNRANTIKQNASSAEILAVGQWLASLNM